MSSTGYDRPEEVLRDADTAMYRAKMLGKARHEVFDKTMHARAMNLLQMEADLRRAIERKEFILHYQPIVALETGTISGFEALPCVKAKSVSAAPLTTPQAWRSWRPTGDGSRSTALCAR